jgi:hypothetical protein
MAAKAKTYFDEHFKLFVDSRPLASELKDARYNVEVWRYEGGARLYLELTYKLPPQGQTFSGRITLYEEDAVFKRSRTLPTEFLTHLTLQGRPRTQLDVPLERPSFSVAYSLLFRTPLDRWIASFWRGIAFWQSAAWLMFGLWALQFLLVPRVPAKSLASVLAAWAIVAPLAVGWHRAEPIGFAVGAFITLLLLAVLGQVLLRLYYRSLMHDSEATAGQFFLSQTRNAAIAFTLAGVYLFIKGF